MMAFKLSKEESDLRSDLVKQLNDQHGELEQAINDYNSATGELRGPVEAAIAHYNEVLAKANSFCEQVCMRGEEEYEEKTEKWQESDAGESAQEWLSEWEQIDMDEIEIEWPDELDMPDTTHSGELEALPDEPSE